MSKIVMYTKSNCVQCRQTKLFLEKAGIDFDVVDLEQDAAALAKVKSMGFSAAPVVQVEGGDTWAGFDPIKLNKLKSSIQA